MRLPHYTSVALLCLHFQSIFALNPSVTQVTPPVDHAEGPFYDSRTNLLYYVDIHSGSLHSYDLETNNLHNITLDGELAVAVPSNSDPSLIIVGLSRSLTAIKWDGRSNLQGVRKLTTIAEDRPRSRFNDGKADTRGRLWFGTMGYEDINGNLDHNNGTLYKFTRTNLANPAIMINPVNISNGIAWNRANDKFYYIDTPTRQVHEYDYDDVSGTISNPRVVFDITDHPTITGYPDGMTIDADDNLWVALYDGGAVVQVNPRSGVLGTVIPIPAQYTTSVAWGGDYHDVLFVTTSRYMLDEHGRQQQPAAGSVFAVKNLETYGYQANYADILDSLGEDFRRKHKSSHRRRA